MEGQLDLTGVDLVTLAKAAYALSIPKGMGFLHAKDGGLTDDEAKGLIQAGSIALSLDYVHGRAVKLTVYRDTPNTLSMRVPWYDHTDAQLDELLQRVGRSRWLARAEKGSHSVACECQDCLGQSQQSTR